jgi:hypothetical protein
MWRIHSNPRRKCLLGRHDKGKDGNTKNREQEKNDQ